MGTFLGENRQNQDIEAWPYLLKATRLDEFKPDHFFNLAIVSSRIATMLRKNPTMKIQPQVDFLDVAQQSFNNVIALIMMYTTITSNFNLPPTPTSTQR